MSLQFILRLCEPSRIRKQLPLGNSERRLVESGQRRGRWIARWNEVLRVFFFCPMQRIYIPVSSSRKLMQIRDHLCKWGQPVGGEVCKMRQADCAGKNELSAHTFSESAVSGEHPLSSPRWRTRPPTLMPERGITIPGLLLFIFLRLVLNWWCSIAFQTIVEKLASEQGCAYLPLEWTVPFLFCQ